MRRGRPLSSDGEGGLLRTRSKEWSRGRTKAAAPLFSPRLRGRTLATMPAGRPPRFGLWNATFRGSAGTVAVPADPRRSTPVTPRLASRRARRAPPARRAQRAAKMLCYLSSPRSRAHLGAHRVAIPETAVSYIRRGERRSRGYPGRRCRTTSAPDARSARSTSTRAKGSRRRRLRVVVAASGSCSRSSMTTTPLPTRVCS